MDDLISLCQLIATQRVEHIDIFDKKKHKGKTWKLYDFIMNGVITNDKEGLALLYGEGGNKHDYNRLKARLENKLLNNLFFVDQSRSEFTDMRRATHSIGKSFVLFNILIERNERKRAISIANKAFTKALKYEKTDFALYLARHLYDECSIMAPSKRKKDKLRIIINDLKEILDHELKSEEYYNEISYLYITKKSKFTKEELNSMKIKCDELRDQQHVIKSFKYNLTTYNLLASYYILTNQHEKCIDCCMLALDFFDKKPYDDTISKYMFRNNLILSAIPQRNFELAQKYTEENFKILSKGSFNWFNQCNYQFILLSAQGKYQSLYQLVLDVTKNKNYKKILLKHEFWNVIEAYVQFLIRAEKIDPSISTDSRKLRSFSLSRFINDVPKFSKDKRGINISILIIQFLFLLQERKYSKLIDRLDAIKQYSYRYLKNDETYRANLFIKMLLKVADVDFHPIAAKRHTKDLHDKLLASNPSVNFQSTEIEVIPYEKLWEIVLELLEKNKKGKTT